MDFKKEKYWKIIEEVKDYLMFLVEFQFLFGVSFMYILISVYHLYLAGYFMSEPDMTTVFYKVAVYTTDTTIFLKLGWLIPLIIWTIIFIKSEKE